MRPDGIDSFGKFDLSGRATCDSCGKDTVGTLMYRSLKLPPGIRLGDTIYGRRFGESTRKVANKPILGITCGCYAKFHRQVVHIEERMKQRGK